MDAKKFGQGLDMEQLENVSGGTYIESLQVAKFLKKAGYADTLNASNTVNYTGTNNALDKLGFTAKHNTGSTENVYTNKETGKEFTQSEMMDFLKQKFPDVK